MPEGFSTYHIFLSAPPDREGEQDVFQNAVAAFGEEVTVPARVLFATASLRRDTEARFVQAAVEGNLRFCDFFVAIAGGETQEPVFTRFIDYAMECAADASKPMRKPWIYFGNSAKASDEMRELRDRLQETCEVVEYRDSEELASRFRSMFAAWYEKIRHAAAPPAI